MSNDDHWASSVIIEARKCCPLVTDAVSARMELLLEGQLSERPLTPTDLKSIATGLTGDMVPVQPKPEGAQ